MKIAIVLAGAIALLVAVGARAQSSDVEGQSDPVVLTVNGQSIHFSDVAMLREGLPAQYRQLPLEMLYPQLINALIDRKLMAQKARDMGLEEDEEVKRQIAFHEETVLEETYLTRAVDAALTDERLKRAYDEFIAGWEPEEEVRARHIVLETEDEAKQVIAELEGGADFEELARTRSIGPSSAKGGDLGYFRREGDMLPAFAEAAFAMRPGETSTIPVETSFGWHVIRVEDRRPAPPPEFEEMSDTLRNQEAEKIVQEISQALREDATIESPAE